MSKLKCPFCNGELVGTIGHPICRNQNCVMCDDPMPQDLLEELIRTKELLEIESSEHELCHDAMVKRTEEVNQICKALEIAVDVLKQIREINIFLPQIQMIDKALEQITALEQKDVK